MAPGIEDIQGLFNRAPQQQQLKSYPEIQQANAEAQAAKQLQQQNAIKLQQQRRDQKDQEIIQKAVMLGQGDPDKTLKLSMEGGVSPQGWFGLNASFSKMRKDAAEATDKENANIKEKLQSTANALQSWLDLPEDAAERNSAEIRRLSNTPDGQPIDRDKITMLAHGATVADKQRDQGIALRAAARADAAEGRAAALAPSQQQISQNTAAAGTLNAQGLTAAQAAVDARTREANTATAVDRTADNARQQQQVDLTRRGQDVSAATQRRGQDMSDARQREQMTETARANQATNKADPVLDKIQQLSQRINTGSGLSAKATGAVRSTLGKTNYDDDVAEYNALIDGAVPLVARALGHTGVLTEQDVQSTRAMFPRAGDSQTLAERKIKQLREIVSGVSGASTGVPVPPRVGDIQDGHAYLGGDPASPNSWKKVK